jgi:hypothetical protein
MKGPLAAFLVLASSVAAQPPAPMCSRGETQLSVNPIDTSPTIHVWMKLSTPKQAAPPASPGEVHTAQVVYAAWWESNPNGDTDLVIDRSTDGGWTWGQNRQVIFTNNSAAGEWTRQQYFRICSWESKVYVVLLSSRLHPSGSSSAEALIALGSEDQGQTWHGPLLLSTGVNGLSTGATLQDCGPPECAVSSGVLHTAFLANYADVGTGTSSSFQDVYYIRAFVGNGALALIDAEEVRLDGAKGGPGTIDSDNPDVAADGQVVTVAWHDDRIVAPYQNPYAGNNDWNNFYCKTSSALGSNFAGLSEVALTNRTQGLAVFTNTPQCAVVGNNVYILVEDGRKTLAYAHDAFLHISRDAGVTFGPGILVNKGPRFSTNGTVNEVDVGRMVVEGQRIVVPYLDSRNGNNNNPNTLFVVVDQNGGADFQAGTHVETQLSFPSLPSLHTDIFNTDMSGRTIAIAFEPRNPAGGGEDGAIAFSYDGGVTWDSRYLQYGAADGDGPTVAVSVNEDIVGIWHDDRLGSGNTANLVFVTGFKVPRLEDLTGQGQGLLVHDARPNQAVLMFPSFTAPASGAFPLDPTRGITLNYTTDGLTMAAIGVFVPFLAVTNAQGDATYAWPNWAKLLGQDIHYAAATFDGTALQWSGFTDPVMQAK